MNDRKRGQSRLRRRRWLANPVNRAKDKAKSLARYYARKTPPVDLFTMAGL